MLADRATRDAGLLARGAAQTLGCLVGASLACVVLVFAVCYGPPPGEGAEAERGFARARPVVAAVLAYHARTGRYPGALTDLVPDALPAAALDPASTPPLEFPFEYHASADSFTLEFRYTGPGMNVCEYASTTRRWRCHGYF